MKNLKAISISTTISSILFIMTVPLIADWRYTTFVRPYSTIEDGHFRLENTTDYQKKDDLDATALQFKLDYGFFSNWSASISGLSAIETGKGSRDFKYMATILETQYRWTSDTSADPWHFALSGNFQSANEGSNRIGLAGIVGKRYQTMDLIANLATAKITADNTDWHTSFALGAYNPFTENFRMGLELFGNLDNDSTAYVAPNFSIFGEGWTVNLGLGFGLNDASQDWLLRNIISYQF
jgi:hypothetical protein